MTVSRAARPLAYLAVFVAATFLFLVGAYPSERLTATVNAALQDSAGGRLTVGRAAYRFPASLALDNVILKNGADEALLGQAVVHPSLWGYLAGRRRAGIALAGPWGRAVLRVTEGGSRQSIQLESVQADLAVLAAGLDLPVSLAGSLTMHGKVEVSGEDRPSMDGSGRVEARDIIVSGVLLKALGAGSLRLDQAGVNWSAAGDVVTVNEARFSGDLTGELSGRLILRGDAPERWPLDLTIRAAPSASAGRKLAPLLTLAGADSRPGGFTVKIGGTVGRPTVRIS